MRDYFYVSAAHNGPGPRHSQGFTITLGHTALCRTPLDEWSARRRKFYLTTHNTRNRQTSMFRRDSSPQFQEASGRRPTPYTVRPSKSVIAKNSVNKIGSGEVLFHGEKMWATEWKIEWKTERVRELQVPILLRRHLTQLRPWNISSRHEFRVQSEERQDINYRVYFLRTNSYQKGKHTRKELTDFFRNDLKGRRHMLLRPGVKTCTLRPSVHVFRPQSVPGIVSPRRSMLQ